MDDERRDMGQKGGGDTEAGRGHPRVGRRARRRKLGQQERAHFLFILLLSERPSLEVASSEHDSLPFFGRAAGIETRRTRGQGKGANPGEAVAIDNERVQVGGQDFEQSQSNHGWPRVALLHGLGTRCGSLARSNIRSKSGPSSLNFLDTTTRVVGASRSSGRHDYSRSPIAYPVPSGPIATPMDRPIAPTPSIWSSSLS